MAINNHDLNSQRWLITTIKGVYVVENFLLSWSLRLRRCPQLPQEVEMESTLEHSGEGQVTSEAWSMSPSPKGQPLHQRNSSDNPAIDSESPKAPSTIFNLNYTVLYTTLWTQLYTQLNSTQQLSKTHHPVFSPCLRQGQRPHRSVGSTPRIHLPKVGGWYQDTIHLEIKEVLEEIFF